MLVATKKIKILAIRSNLPDAFIGKKSVRFRMLHVVAQCHERLEVGYMDSEKSECVMLWLTFNLHCTLKCISLACFRDNLNCVGRGLKLYSLTL